MGKGVERVAEILDADAVALVRDGSVIAAAGFADGYALGEGLVAVAEGRARSLAVPGVGECAAASTSLEGQRPLNLVVARRAGTPFGREELALLAGMGRVLTLELRNLRLLENERTLRSESEHQANENARLLEALRERQVLLERLSQLQRAIVDRLPVHEVLEAVVDGACELLGDEVGALRIADPDDPSHTTLVAAIGADERLLAERRRQPLSVGMGGRTVRERCLIVADVVSGGPTDEAMSDFPAQGLTAAMTAPP